MIEITTHITFKHNHQAGNLKIYHVYDLLVTVICAKIIKNVGQIPESFQSINDKKN